MGVVGRTGGCRYLRQIFLNLTMSLPYDSVLSVQPMYRQFGGRWDRLEADPEFSLSGEERPSADSQRVGRIRIGLGRPKKSSAEESPRTLSALPLAA